MRKAGGLFSTEFVMLCGVSLLYFFGHNIFHCAVPLYVDSLNMGAAVSGAITLVFSISGIAARLFGGYLSDRKGKIFVMTLGCIVFAVSGLCFGFSRTVFLLLLFRALHGVGFAMTNTSSTALCADMVPQQRLGEGLGYFSMGGTVSSAFSSALVLWLIEKSGYTSVFSLGFVFLLACLALILTLGKRTGRINAVPQAKSGGKFNIASLIEKKALPAAAVYLLTNIATCSVLVFLLLFAKDAGFANAALFNLIGAAAMFASNLIAPRLSDRYGGLVVLIPGLLIGAAALVLLAVTKSMAVFLLAGLFYGACMGLSGPVLNSLALKNIPPERSGTASSTFLLTADFGVGIGSSIWGILIDFSGYSTVWLTAAGVMLAAIVLCVVFFSKQNIKEAASGEN